MEGEEKKKRRKSLLSLFKSDVAPTAEPTVRSGGSLARKPSVISKIFKRRSGSSAKDIYSVEDGDSIASSQPAFERASSIQDVRDHKHFFHKIKEKFRKGSMTDLTRSDTIDSQQARPRTLLDFFDENEEDSAVSLVNHFDCQLSLDGERYWTGMLMIGDEELKFLGHEDDSVIQINFDGIEEIVKEKDEAKITIKCKDGHNYQCSEMDQSQIDKTYYSMRIAYNRATEAEQRQEDGTPKNRFSTYITSCECGDIHNGLTLVQARFEGVVPRSVDESLRFNDGPYSFLTVKTAHVKALRGDEGFGVEFPEIYGDLQGRRIFAAKPSVIHQGADLIQTEVILHSFIKNFDHRQNFHLLVCASRPDPFEHVVNLRLILLPSPCEYRKLCSLTETQLIPWFKEWLQKGLDRYQAALPGADDEEDAEFAEACPGTVQVIKTILAFGVTPRYNRLIRRIKGASLFRYKEKWAAFLLVGLILFLFSKAVPRQSLEPVKFLYSSYRLGWSHRHNAIKRNLRHRIDHIASSINRL